MLQIKILTWINHMENPHADQKSVFVHLISVNIQVQFNPHPLRG